jgi:hypothetical protein
LYGLWFTPLHVSLKKTWSLHAAVARQWYHDSLWASTIFSHSLRRRMHWSAWPLCLRTQCLFFPTREKTHWKMVKNRMRQQKLVFKNGCLLINRCLYYGHQNSSW